MKKRKEEILEMACMADEEGEFRRQHVAQSPDERISMDMLDELIHDGYLEESDGKIRMTEAGRAEAKHIIRSHRLSERLFVDVLDLPLRSMETHACTFEHFLSLEVVDSICTLLGHPRECPHGRPIPPGPCCKSAQSEIKPVVQPLSETKSGDRVKIVYLVTKQHQRLDQLTALGIVPGAVIAVHQTLPAYVIKVNETDIALEKEVAQSIYVRPK